MSSIAIIIPTLKKAGTIERLLNLIFAVTREHNFGTEVIVVDDGSQDGTRETFADLCSRLPITLICRNDRQSGTLKMSRSVIRSYFCQLARLCSMPISSRFWAIFSR